jgi:hypothetical protein
MFFSELASDNSLFFRHLFCSTFAAMAEFKEPKKETVRITLPPQGSPPEPPVARPRDTVRINLPARPPSNGGAPRPVSTAPVRPPVSADVPAFRPPSKPPDSGAPVSYSPPVKEAQTAAARAPQPITDPGASPFPGPKKETARITVLPDPPKVTGPVQMKKTQPLISMPEKAAPVMPVNVALRETKAVLDTIPVSLCWTLLGVSALVLLIQIWNYIS